MTYDKVSVSALFIDHTGVCGRSLIVIAGDTFVVSNQCIVLYNRAMTPSF
jgi:hypothetical protein